MMIKRNIIKKVIALMSVLILILMSINPIFAATTVKENSIIYDEAIINKYITKTDEKNHLYDIVLEVEGKNKAEKPPSDIVLVVDESNSMTGQKFEKSKTGCENSFR